MAPDPFLPIATPRPVGSIPPFPGGFNVVAPPATPAAAAPAKPAPPPPIPDSRRDALAIPSDVLQIGGSLFGQAVHRGEIRELARGMTVDDAMKLTAGKNGLDEIYFVDEDNRLFVLFAQKDTFEDVAKGFLGRYNGKRIRVVEVDDENNNFRQGMRSTWVWLKSALTNSFGTEAGKSINGLMSTAIGSFVAAAALKSSVPTTVVATNGKNLVAATEGLLKGVGGAFQNAFTGFIQTMASIVLFGVGAVGAFSVYAGVKGHLKQGDMTAIDMVTGRF